MSEPRAAEPVMIHDTAVTSRFIIVMDLPMVFQIERMLQGNEFMHFEKNRESRFGILPKDSQDGSDIAWFRSPSCFVFHTANAWEEGDEVVLVACRSKISSSAGIVSDEDVRELSKDLEDSYARLHMWRFNMRTGEVIERQLANGIPCEFPVVSPAVVGRKTRQLYLSMAAPKTSIVESEGFYGVMKYNVDEDTYNILSYGLDFACGEVCFIDRNKPNEPGYREDLAFLGVFLTDKKALASFFSIIDAQEMKEIARVEIPARVPMGFHGKYFDEGTIAQQKI